MSEPKIAASKQVMAPAVRKERADRKSHGTENKHSNEKLMIER